MNVKHIVEKYGESLCSKNEEHAIEALDSIFGMLVTEMNEMSKSQKVKDKKAFTALAHSMDRKGDLIVSESSAKYGPMTIQIRPNWFMEVTKKQLEGMKDRV